MKTVILLSLCLVGVVTIVALKAQPIPPVTESPQDSGVSADETIGEKQVPDPPGMDQFRRLDKKHQVWIDTKGNRVLLGAVVSCREGVLEMFACPAGTKEYESVLAVQSPAYQVHAALMAIGAKPGSTVSFMPEYKPASGPIVDVHVNWSEGGKEKRVRGQEFVKQLKTGEAMTHDWVFCGSGFWTDEETGEEYYHAEGGELICVSNFSTALMDVTVESSQQNNELMFGPFTEKIPPLGTQVVIELSLQESLQENE